MAASNSDKTPVFVGIDLACAKNEPLPICFATTKCGALKPVAIPKHLSTLFPTGPGNIEIMQKEPFKQLAAKVVDALCAIEDAQGWNFVGVAIDAPAAPPTQGERRSEVEMRRRRLSSFQTPDVERGFVCHSSAVDIFKKGSLSTDCLTPIRFGCSTGSKSLVRYARRNGKMLLKSTHMQSYALWSAIARTRLHLTDTLSSFDRLLKQPDGRRLSLKPNCGDPFRVASMTG